MAGLVDQDPKHFVEVALRTVGQAHRPAAYPNPWWRKGAASRPALPVAPKTRLGSSFFLVRLGGVRADCPS